MHPIHAQIKCVRDRGGPTCVRSRRRGLGCVWRQPMPKQNVESVCLLDGEAMTWPQATVGKHEYLKADLTLLVVAKMIKFRHWPTISV